MFIIIHSVEATTDRSCTILLVHVFTTFSNTLEVWLSCHYVYTLRHHTFTQAHTRRVLSVTLGALHFGGYGLMTVAATAAACWLASTAAAIKKHAH
jgi:hypothetical protein